MTNNNKTVRKQLLKVCWTVEGVELFPQRFCAKFNLVRSLFKYICVCKIRYFPTFPVLLNGNNVSFLKSFPTILKVVSPAKVGFFPVVPDVVPCCALPFPGSSSVGLLGPSNDLPKLSVPLGFLELLYHPWRVGYTRNRRRESCKM